MDKKTNITLTDLVHYAVQNRIDAEMIVENPEPMWYDESFLLEGMKKEARKKEEAATVIGTDLFLFGNRSKFEQLENLIYLNGLDHCRNVINSYHDHEDISDEQIIEEFLSEGSDEQTY